MSIFEEPKIDKAYENRLPLLVYNVLECAFYSTHFGLTWHGAYPADGISMPCLIPATLWFANGTSTDIEFMNIPNTHYTHTSKFFYTPLVGIHQNGYIYSEVVNIYGINYLITAHRFWITAAVISAISCFIFRHTAANGMLLVSRARNRKLTLCPSHLNNSMGQPDWTVLQG